MPNTFRRKTAIMIVLLLAAVCALVAPLYDALLIGTGYTAKTAASAIFVDNRTLEAVQAQELSYLSMFDLAVDQDDQSVTASVFGLAPRKAVYIPQYGASLVFDREEEVRAARPPFDATPGKPDLITRNDSVPGVDYVSLQETLDWALTGPNAAPPINTRAVVVFHDGQLVAEGYADGFDAQSLLGGFSMTKSVTNALVGILVKEGRLEVAAPAPIQAWHKAGDSRNDITLNHLLQMSSGLQFSEEYFNPFADAVKMLFAREDVAAYARAKPLAHAPGTVWSYSSGTTNILQGIIRDTLGDDETYWRFPRKALFAPLGMESAFMEMDTVGTYVGSSFMWATARDWARFGLLYLNDGVWEGERILPEGWVAYSTTPAPAAPQGNYGAQWWLNAGTTGDPEDRPLKSLPTDVYFASGFEGQKVYVAPSHKAVIVRLGCTQGQGWSNEELARRVLEALPRMAPR